MSTICDEGAIYLSRTGLLLKIAIFYNDCYISNDIDMLTVMNDDILIKSSSPRDTRYQRDVSQIHDVSE